MSAGSSRSSPSTTSRPRGGSSARGGWEAADAPERFARFCARTAAAIGDIVGMGCTLNEPNIVSLMGYLAAVFPPGVRDIERRRAVTANFCRAHRLAVEELRSGPGDYPVGLTLSMTEYQATPGGEERRDRIRRSMEDVFLEATARRRLRRRPDLQQDARRARRRPRCRAGGACHHDGLRALAAGTRGDDPAGLGGDGRDPVLVTENGISTEDDAERVELRQRGPRGGAALSGRRDQRPRLHVLEPS